MANFPGGSAFAMAREVAGGYILVTERTFKSFDPGQLSKLDFELDRILRELRAEQPPLEDRLAVQERHRKIQRVTGARMMLQAYRSRIRR